MKDGLFTQNPEYHETLVTDDDDLISLLVELSDRLGDEPDYEEYLSWRIKSAIDFVLGMGGEE